MEEAHCSGGALQEHQHQHQYHQRFGGGGSSIGASTLPPRDPLPRYPDAGLPQEAEAVGAVTVVAVVPGKGGRRPAVARSSGGDAKGRGDRAGAAREKSGGGGENRGSGGSGSGADGPFLRGGAGLDLQGRAGLVPRGRDQNSDLPLSPPAVARRGGGVRGGRGLEEAGGLSHPGELSAGAEVHLILTIIVTDFFWHLL